MVNQKWEEPLDKAKPFDISKHVVWEAYLRVKANKGAAGIDEQSIADFERELKNNLYKIWNRMSSGSYFPPPVRTVSIPKSGGGLVLPTGFLKHCIQRTYLDTKNGCNCPSGALISKDIFANFASLRLCEKKIPFKVA